MGADALRAARKQSDYFSSRLRVVATPIHGERAVAERVLPAMRVDEVVELELQQLYVTATRDGCLVRLFCASPPMPCRT